MFEGRRSSINYVLEGDALDEGRAGKGVADFPIFGEGQEGRASGFGSIKGALRDERLGPQQQICPVQAKVSFSQSPSRAESQINTG